MRPSSLLPFISGDQVFSSYRVPPFLADEVLTVLALRNVGTKKRPEWRVRVQSWRGPEGWLDASTLTKTNVHARMLTSLLRQMEEALARAGFDPTHALQLQEEGMGPHELAERLSIPSGVGSLQYTHGFRRDPAPTRQVRHDVDAALGGVRSGRR